MSVVAAAIIGSAVVGGVAANASSRRASSSANAATQAQTDAAAASEDLGRQELEWAQFQYEDTRDEREQAYADQRQIAQAQLATMRQQNSTAADYDAYNRDTFRPLEQRIVADATNYDTPERRQAAADAASADVRIAQAGQQGALTRSLQRSGVNPGSGTALATMGDLAFQGTKAEAGAATMARRNVETVGAARMADAANLGRNLPSAQAAAVSTGIQAGNSASGASSAGLGATQSGTGVVQQGFAGARAGAQAAGSLYGSAAGNYNAIATQQSNAWMRGADLAAGGRDSMFGTYLASSDPKVKKDRKKVSTASMLEAVEGNKVDSWQYDPDKGGPDDGGETHIGPMADRTQELLGDDVAPGGKAIDLVSMNGVTMGAVQELSKRVKRIEARMRA